MTIRNLGIETDAIVYKPVTGENFGTLCVPTDGTVNELSAVTVEHDLHLSMLDACPRYNALANLCGGRIEMQTDPQLPLGNIPVTNLGSYAITNCRIVCKRVDCPPRPESGDREPLVPDPNQPSLFAEELLPHIL